MHENILDSVSRTCDSLVETLSIFNYPSIVDFTFLKTFFKRDVAAHANYEVRRGILDHFKTMLTDSNHSERIKFTLLGFSFCQYWSIFSMRQILEKEREEQSTIDTALCKTIVSTMLVPDQLNRYGKEMHIEMLRLATLLIENMAKPLVDHRKELIKFAWNHLKSESTSVKHWAYVNVCSFIAQYETPAKIVLQVYVALLRTHQDESKVLVNKALSVLVPSLPFRLRENDFMKAIKWTKKVIFEEGHSLPQVSSHIVVVLSCTEALVYATYWF